MKQADSFTQLKANLTITSLIEPWGSKPLLLTKNQSLKAPQIQYKRPQSDLKATMFYL